VLWSESAVAKFCFVFNDHLTAAAFKILVFNYEFCGGHRAAGEHGRLRQRRGPEAPEAARSPSAARSPLPAPLQVLPLRDGERPVERGAFLPAGPSFPQGPVPALRGPATPP